jgi:acetyltransferase
VDLVELEKLLVRFSYLVVEQKWIKEIDINPLLASADALLALDARVVLHPGDVVDPPLPAIRPYPVQYVKPWRFEDGMEVIIRPIRHVPRQSFRAQHLSTLLSLAVVRPAGLS